MWDVGICNEIQNLESELLHIAEEMTGYLETFLELQRELVRCNPNELKRKRDGFDPDNNGSKSTYVKIAPALSSISTCSTSRHVKMAPATSNTYYKLANKAMNFVEAAFQNNAQLFFPILTSILVVPVTVTFFDVETSIIAVKKVNQLVLTMVYPENVS